MVAGWGHDARQGGRGTGGQGGRGWGAGGREAGGQGQGARLHKGSTGLLPSFGAHPGGISRQHILGSHSGGMCPPLHKAWPMNLALALDLGLCPCLPGSRRKVGWASGWGMRAGMSRAGILASKPRTLGRPPGGFLESPSRPGLGPFLHGDRLAEGVLVSTALPGPPTTVPKS